MGNGVYRAAVALVSVAPLGAMFEALREVDRDVMGFTDDLFARYSASRVRFGIEITVFVGHAHVE